MAKICAKFQKDRYKIVWGVALSRYPLSIYWGQKMTKFTKWKKWQKNNLAIISKPHAHPHTMTKTHAKFQKDRYKTVRGVALTRYPLSIHFHRIWGQEMTKFAKWKKWQKLIQGLYPTHMHIFRPWKKHVQSFKKVGIKLCEELRSQGTHCLYIEVKKWLSSRSGKSDKKIISHLYPNHMHILIPWRKHMQSFKKIGTKL